MDDWTNPRRIPMGYGGRDQDPLSPEFLQTNLFTLCQIGGLYDLIAYEVERRHESILTPWRLVSQAPTVLDYIQASGRAAEPDTQETRNQNGEDTQPHDPTQDLEA